MMQQEVESCSDDSESTVSSCSTSNASMAMAASNLHSIATDRPIAQGTQVKYFSKKNGRWCTAEVARVDKDIIELKVHFFVIAIDFYSKRHDIDGILQNLKINCK